MKKIYILSAIALAFIFVGCSDFLDKTPNASGSAYIYHMDQLEGMMGNPGPYRTGYCWADCTLLGDGVELTPYFAVKTGSTGDVYSVYAWDADYIESASYFPACTWTPTWNGIFSFNTVLENMDNVTQTTRSIRKQVGGRGAFRSCILSFQYVGAICTVG